MAWEIRIERKELGSREGERRTHDQTPFSHSNGSLGKIGDNFLLITPIKMILYFLESSQNSLQFDILIRDYSLCIEGGKHVWSLKIHAGKW